ncbi:MAG: hypothetical protein FJW92_02280 [Actinobacteria bacterium]|nr:hypothetical protein [Actinomycetota bacterium]
MTRVLDECLNNALVHGGATQAVVRITRSPDAWVVEVTDDGRGPAGGAPGLGTALLDDVTGGEWSLIDAAGGGAVVRAVIPQRTRTPAS